jgi:HicB family
MAHMWCHNGAMDLRTYVESIHQQLATAAEAGGEDAQALAERLVAPLDAAIRLALQDVLAAAAEEITCELAPGSVELRLRGRNPEFVVTPPPDETSAGDLSGSEAPPTAVEADDGAMARINLRMPDHIKARIERAADRHGISVNAWLLRAATGALDRGDLDQRREPRTPHSAQRYTGWAR